MKHFVRPRLISSSNNPARILAVALSGAVVLLIACAAQAQTMNLLYHFAGPVYSTSSGVTIAGANLYGTGTGGEGGYVYELRHSESGYTLNLLHSFAPPSDGAIPLGGVVFGREGELYGATSSSFGTGTGTVFDVRPSATICDSALCPWMETVINRFSFQDGSAPQYGELATDPAGNLYGTTLYGGTYDEGVVYQLSPSGDGWTENVLYSFGTGGQYDGSYPLHNVILDRAGNIYGTTSLGGPNGYGTVFQLVPSGSGWTENILVSFPELNTGNCVSSGLIIDDAGNLYGATSGCNGYPGTASVFELSPSGSGWQLNVLHSFTLSTGNVGPVGNLVMDSSGNLYGITESYGPSGNGNFFKLSPSANGWVYTDLYDFPSGYQESPVGDLAIDANGNIYGTSSGESESYGSVWEFTP